jgi:hypothetical protein
MSRGWIEGAFGSRRWAGAALGLAGLAAGFLLWQGLQPCDDAYITFRHARNLAAHLRPAWNLAGEPVMGSTAPAFVLLLGLPGLLAGGAHIESVALGVNAVLHGIVVLLAYLVTFDLLRRSFPALLAAILVAASSVNVFVFSLGFENAMLTATLLGSLWAARRGRPGVALMLASLAPLIRPEGLLVTPLVWAHVFLARRFRPAHVACFLLVPLLWLGLSCAYYGSPVPQPIVAKKKFPALYRPYRNAEVSLLERVPGLPAHIASLWSGEAERLLATGSETPGRLGLRGRLVLWLAIAGWLVLLGHLVRRRDGRLIYLLYGPLFLVLYAWIGRTEVWYWPSFVTLATLALFAGLAHSLLALAERTRLSRWRLGEAALLAAFVALLASNHYRLNRGPDTDSHKAALYAADPRGRAWRGYERERFESYQEAAGYLNRRSPAPGPALASEVGVFGYFYAGPVIDAVGICSPEALAFYPPPSWDIFDAKGRYRTWANNFVPTAMVTTLEPHYVVNSLVYIANLLRKGSPVPRCYRPARRLGRAWGQPVYILERADSPPPEPVIAARAGSARPLRAAGR